MGWGTSRVPHYHPHKTRLVQGITEQENSPQLPCSIHTSLALSLAPFPSLPLSLPWATRVLVRLEGFNGHPIAARCRKFEGAAGATLGRCSRMYIWLTLLVTEASRKVRTRASFVFLSFSSLPLFLFPLNVYLLLMCLRMSFHPLFTLFVP